MLHPSTKKLVDRLIEMTELGKLRWEETDQDSILYSTEGYSVTIVGTPQEIVITSREGRELERANSAELAETLDAGGRAYSELVAQMYKEASRIARGTEAAISSLLAGIDVESQTDVEPVEPAAPIVAAPETIDAPETLADTVTDETTVLAEEGLVSDAVDTNIEAEDANDAEETFAAANEADGEVADDIEQGDAEPSDPSAPVSLDAAPEEVTSSNDDLAETLAADETASLATEETPSEDTESSEQDASIVDAAEGEVSQVDETTDAPEAAPTVAEAEPADIALAPDNVLSDDPYEEDVDTPKMTAAVARLAEEVNGRENPSLSFPQAGALTAAAGGLATAVALAEEAPEAADSEITAEDTEIENTDISAETANLEPEAVESEIELSADTSDAGYVPFGVTPKETDLDATIVATETVTETPEAAAVPEPEVMRAPVMETAPEPESAPEPVMAAAPEPESAPEPIMDAAPEPESAPEPVMDAAPEPESAPEPVMDAAPEPESAPMPVMDVAPEPESAPEPVMTAEPEPEITPEPIMEAAPEPESGPEPVMTAEPEPEITPEPVMDAAPEPEVTHEPVMEAAPEPESAPEPVMTAEPEPEIAPEPVMASVAATEPPTQPQTFSLSGIGAGFGLTPLAATTEASGTPGAQNPASGEASPAKIVIDAVDEVPPPASDVNQTGANVLSGLSFPKETRDSASPTEEITTPVPAASEGEAASDDDTMLKPRTRFNPWD